jgi:acylphosphatase
MQRLHLLLSGRVQGIGFRFFALSEARRRGVTGWVRNRADRQVEVVAEGPEAELQALLAALQKGPVGARVDKAEVSWLPVTGEFSSFEARANW